MACLPIINWQNPGNAKYEYNDFKLDADLHIPEQLEENLLNLNFEESSKISLS